MLLEQKTAVITGCNRGIGKATLETFAENGADIFACVRKESDEFTKKVRMWPPRLKYKRILIN